MQKCYRTARFVVHSNRHYEQGWKISFEITACQISRPQIHSSQTFCTITTILRRTQGEEPRRRTQGEEPRDSPHVSWFLTHQSRDRFLSHRPPKSALICSPVSARPEAVPVTTPPDSTNSRSIVHCNPPFSPCPVRYYQSGPHSLSAAPSTNYKKMKNEANSRNRTPVPGQPKLDPP